MILSPLNATRPAECIPVQIEVSSCSHEWVRVPHDGGTKRQCVKCGMRDHDSWLPSS